VTIYRPDQCNRYTRVQRFDAGRKRPLVKLQFSRFQRILLTELPVMTTPTWSWTTLKRLQSADLTADKFWSSATVWNAKPHLLIKHLMGAERIVSESLAGDYGAVLTSVTTAHLPPAGWAHPTETFRRLGLTVGEDVRAEVWKLFTKKPVDWNDYLRLSIFGKSLPGLPIHIKLLEYYNIIIMLLFGQTGKIIPPCSATVRRRRMVTTKMLSNMPMVFVSRMTGWSCALPCRQINL